jgi:hypothetical protein
MASDVFSAVIEFPPVEPTVTADYCGRLWHLTSNRIKDIRNIPACHTHLEAWCASANEAALSERARRYGTSQQRC